MPTVMAGNPAASLAIALWRFVEDGVVPASSKVCCETVRACSSAATPVSWIACSDGCLPPIGALWLI